MGSAPAPQDARHGYPGLLPKLPAGQEYVLAEALWADPAAFPGDPHLALASGPLTADLCECDALCECEEKR